MKKRTVFTLSFVWLLIIFSLLTTLALAGPKVFYGRVLGTVFNVIQVRGDDGKIWWFWINHSTHYDSRVPFGGDRVRIEFVKDKLGRNAVARITILGRR
jgi:hypothetical protein